MDDSIEIVCLANSHKNGERCVAGVRLDTGGWIRPVSSVAGEALLQNQYETKAGYAPQPLDTIRVSLSRQRPKYNQSENWVIGTESWELVTTELDRAQLLAINTALQRDGNIICNADNWISRQALKERPVFRSLTLIRPSQPEFFIKERDDGPQPRARFDFDGSTYNLPITDPSWRERVSATDPDTLPSTDAVGADEEILFTISLGEAYEGRCYKLVAAIFTIPSDQLVEI